MLSTCSHSEFRKVKLSGIRKIDWGYLVNRRAPPRAHLTRFSAKFSSALEVGKDSFCPESGQRTSHAIPLVTLRSCVLFSGYKTIFVGATLTMPVGTAEEQYSRRLGIGETDLILTSSDKYNIRRSF